MIRAGKLAGHRPTCLTPAELHPSTTITRRSPPLFEQLTAEQQDARRRAAGYRCVDQARRAWRGAGTGRSSAMTGQTHLPTYRWSNREKPLVTS